MKKTILFMIITLLYAGVNGQQMDNKALYSLLQAEDEIAIATGQSCNAQGRTFQEIPFEEQLDYALSLHDTATVLKTEELALEHVIKTTKNHPKQWLGFYWAAHLYGQVGRLYKDNDKFIMYMERAHENLKIAQKLNTPLSHEDKSELLILESLLYRLSGFTLYNPRTGININKQEAEKHVKKSLNLLAQAEDENPNNPRVHLQKGIVSTLNANYEQAVKDFNNSLSLYDNNPASSRISPNWGKGWLEVWLPRAEKLLNDAQND